MNKRAMEKQAMLKQAYINGFVDYLEKQGIDKELLQYMRENPEMAEQIIKQAFLGADNAWEFFKNPFTGAYRAADKIDNKWLRWGTKGLIGLGDVASYAIPYYGTARLATNALSSAGSMAKNLGQGNWGAAGMDALGLGANLIPGGAGKLMGGAVRKGLGAGMTAGAGAAAKGGMQAAKTGVGAGLREMASAGRNIGKGYMPMNMKNWKGIGAMAGMSAVGGGGVPMSGQGAANPYAAMQGLQQEMGRMPNNMGFNNWAQTPVAGLPMGGGYA